MPTASAASAASASSALRLDVADLLVHPASRRAVTLAAPLELTGTSARVGAAHPVEVDVVLERVPDGVVVRGSVRAVWEGECGVCLAPLERSLVVAVRELYEPDPVEGETYPLDGSELDLEALVRDAVGLELPLAPECAPGGCTKRSDPEWRSRLGAPPDTDPEPAPDPRWAGLEQLERS